MLVLSRKHNESVIIGGANPLERLVKVTVLRIGPGRVSLGFEACEAVPILRWEVRERSDGQQHRSNTECRAGDGRESNADAEP